MLSARAKYIINILFMKPIKKNEGGDDIEIVSIYLDCQLVL